MDINTEQICVLHVDDSPKFMELTVDALERENDRLDISTASTAAEGFDCLADSRIDCVVSDYEMPDENGIEFLRSVREEYPELPFILFTGNGSEELASEAISAGVTDYVQKQSGTDQFTVLANRVTNAVDASRARQVGHRQLEAIESAQEGISILDSEGRFVYVNDTYADLYGYEPEEMIDQHWELVYKDEDTPRIYDDVLTTVEETGRWNGVTTGLRADGSTFTEEHVLAKTDTDELVCTVRDISDRRAYREQLERTRDLLAQTEQIADVGGWELDAETMEVFWTDHLFELMGRADSAEPPLEDALDVYHEDDQPMIEEGVNRALEHQEAFDVEARFRPPDDELRWLQVQGTPMIEAGEVTKVRGAVKDITERRTRERVLRQMYQIISDSDRSFEGQVQSLLDLGRSELGMQYGTLSAIHGDEYVFDIVADPDGDIEAGDVVPVSATSCEVVAETEQTLVLDDIAPEDSSKSESTDFPKEGISSYIGSPVFLDTEIYGTFCFYDTEPQADQLSDWEQTLVDLMSRWVSHGLEQRQSKERLRSTNEQLEQFASIASHDLRNPLNVASLRLDLAMEALDRPNEHLEKVAQAHDRMEALIEDLLSLALEGDQVSETEPVDLASLVEQSREHVDMRSGEIAVGDLQSIEADRSRLKQLVENLFRNSIEHSADQVEITVKALDGGFAIEDDGPGIPADEQESIFEPGYTTSEGGTGFGLSIVKQIVTAHGWEIDVTTSDSGGARFEITGVDVLSR